MEKRRENQVMERGSLPVSSRIPKPGFEFSVGVPHSKNPPLIGGFFFWMD